MNLKSIKKHGEDKIKKRIANGFLILEVMLTATIAGLLVTAFIGAIVYGQESTALAGNRARAVFIAEEGLEGVRAIRDQNFNNLVDGTYGLAVGSFSTWTLADSQDTTDIFTRQIVISSIGMNTKQVVSTVTWQQNQQRTGSISLTTRLTNWHILFSQGSHLIFDSGGIHVGGNGKSRIEGGELGNDGTMNITVDKIVVSWTTPNQNINEIKIGGNLVWSKIGPGSPLGQLVSGTQIDIVDFTIAPGEDTDINWFAFTGNMTGATLTTTYIMKDGTQKTFTATP